MAARLRDASPVIEVHMEMDKDGERTYQVTYLIEVDEGDGPNVALNCPGLPIPGDSWQMDSDSDSSAFCWWSTSVRKHALPNEPAKFYAVGKTFSTKAEQIQQCREQAKENPLLELPKITGTYSKYTEEAVVDRYGKAITYSSFERIRGPQNEWDKNRIGVKIQQNVASFQLGVALPSQMMDCVNLFPLWGFPPRCVKLSSAPWEKNYYGPCIPYYTRTLEFEIRCNKLDNGTIETWDRYILDESTKVLQGKWVGSGSELTWVPGFQVAGMTGDPDPNNPLHFMRCADVQGNLQKMVLNGAGLPANVMTAIANAQFVSIQAGNLNKPLSNMTWWIEIQNPDLVDLPTWDGTTLYQRGNIVQWNDNDYVALFSNGDPPAAPDGDPDNWRLLGAHPALTDQGVWSAATTYALGAYVNDAGQTGPAGYRFVQRYPSVDLSLLGIPMTL